MIAADYGDRMRPKHTVMANNEVDARSYRILKRTLSSIYRSTNFTNTATVFKLETIVSTFEIIDLASAHTLIAESYNFF
jgi:hypothetical protein